MYHFPLQRNPKSIIFALRRRRNSPLRPAIERGTLAAAISRAESQPTEVEVQGLELGLPISIAPLRRSTCGCRYQQTTCMPASEFHCRGAIDGKADVCWTRCSEFAQYCCDGGRSLARTPQIVALTQVTEWDNGTFRRKEDYLAAEEPLEIRVGAQPLSVTMRTPGNDLELAAGFLYTEGIIERRGQILELEENAGETPANRANAVRARLAPEAAPDFAKMRRHFFAASSCGICGKASIDAIRARALAPLNDGFQIDVEALTHMPEALRESQAVFGRTGGLHAAALFDAEGKLLVMREDIGRHNAVDKVVGWALLKKRLPLSSTVLLVSGRGGFEIVQKAIVAGLPVVASVSAPSSLAVQLARELRQTLIGFLRGRRFVIYSCEERIAGL